MLLLLHVMLVGVCVMWGFMRVDFFLLRDMFLAVDLMIVVLFVKVLFWVFLSWTWS